VVLLALFANFMCTLLFIAGRPRNYAILYTIAPSVQYSRSTAIQSPV